jgi:hypothetical protein
MKYKYLIYRDLVSFKQSKEHYKKWGFWNISGYNTFSRRAMDKDNREFKEYKVWSGL